MSTLSVFDKKKVAVATFPGLLKKLVIALGLGAFVILWIGLVATSFVASGREAALEHWLIAAAYGFAFMAVTVGGLSLMYWASDKFTD